MALAAPFLYDQTLATALRGGGSPIAITPVGVFSDAIPDPIRRILDVPAYWLVYLPVEFPAFFPAGVIGLVALLRSGTLEPERRQSVRVLALLAATSLSAGWLLASVIAENNDLGWRAVLPAVMVLVAVAAAAISRWVATRACVPLVLATAAISLSLPSTDITIRGDLEGLRNDSEKGFAVTPELWNAVRRHSTATERVANNPLFMTDVTKWTINISWALMANRRSCYAGRELAIPFAPISAARRDEIEAQFIRVFAGKPEGADVQQLADHFHCDVVVVTPQDGAWESDPFASANFYHQVEMRPGAWRIYRRATQRP